MSKLDWVDVVDKREVERTPNSKVVMSAVVARGNEDEVVVSLCEFDRYLNADERAQGLKKEDVPMKPSKYRITFKAEIIDDIIDALNEIRDELDAKGML